MKQKYCPTCGEPLQNEKSFFLAFPNPMLMCLYVLTSFIIFVFSATGDWATPVFGIANAVCFFLPMFFISMGQKGYKKEGASRFALFVSKSSFTATVAMGVALVFLAYTTIFGVGEAKGYKEGYDNASSLWESAYAAGAAAAYDSCSDYLIPIDAPSFEQVEDDAFRQYEKWLKEQEND